MVRCKFRPIVEHHHSHFRTTIHAVHRHSLQCFGIPAFSSWEGAYKHNHFMSDYWALHDLNGDGEVDTASIQDHYILDNHPTTNDSRATSHRRHGKHDNAATETDNRKTYDGNAQGKSYKVVPLLNHEKGGMSQGRNVYSAPDTKIPDNQHRTASGSKRKENGCKKHNKPDHPISESSKTRDNGYRKHDDMTGNIKARHPRVPSSTYVESQRVRSCEPTTVNLGLDDGTQTIAAVEGATRSLKYTLSSCEE